MPKLVIGIRAYLRNGKSELDFQLKEVKKYFPSAKIVIALCGNSYISFARRKADKIIHYSNEPLGLGKAWEILTNYAKTNNADELIIIDGDDRHYFNEVKRLYEENKNDLVIPEREKRFIFLNEKEIHGVTLEDLENSFIRLKHKILINDLQPGLFIIKNKRLINSLDFSNKDSWIGDMLFLDQVLDKNISINTPVIKVRAERYSDLSIRPIFMIIKRYENYFNIKFLDVINKVKANPTRFLLNGRLSEIPNIENSFLEFINESKVQNMKGIILAGGLGTRLRPITYTIHKQLIPVANKPIIFYVIEDLVNAGIKNIGIVVGQNKEQFIKIVGDGSRWNIEITYIEQKDPKGIAHAVLVSKDFLQEKDFVMYLGDNLLKEGINDFVIRFNNSNVDASILLTQVKDPQKFGIAKLDNKGNVIQLLEKPKNPPSNLAIVGVYAFRNSIFNAISKIKPSKRGELEITDALQWLLENNYKISSTLVKGFWKDTGNAEALLDANRIILDSRITDGMNYGKLSKSVVIKGRVKIEKGTIILDNTIINGPTTIGRNCKIGPNAYIGPYTSIGNNVVIKQAEVEQSIILNNSNINSNKRIVNSIIGENSIVSSSKNTLPGGHRLIISDNSEVEL